MEDKKEPPDAIYTDSYDRQPTSKERAKMIYDELMSHDDLMRELNVLLRKHKLEKLKK